MPFPYTFFPLGDDAVTVDFGNRIDEALNRCVLQLFQRLQGRSSLIKDLVPSYSSLTVYFHTGTSATAARNAAERLVAQAAAETDDTDEAPGRTVRIPVCYAVRFAPDLDALAAQKGLSMEEVVRLHTAVTYRVYTIGFLPGFAYMGKVDPQLATPRKTQPRQRVPAGAVGIAGEQTGIYPLPSPGGWNLIGQTPIALFDAATEPPVLLQPGDTVSFYSISEDEFENYPRRTA